MSTSRDQRIGENIAAYRRGRSQEWLAEQMRERGHEKWSQSTVWSVEKGKRPLKFSEALDLAQVLGLPDATSLADGRLGRHLVSLTQEAHRHAGALASAVGDLREVQAVLREALDALGEDRSKIDAGTLAVAERWASRSIEEIAGVKLPDPASAEQLERLRAIALPLQRSGRGGLYECRLGHASVTTFLEGVRPPEAVDCSANCGNKALLVAIPDDEVSNG